MELDKKNIKKIVLIIAISLLMLWGVQNYKFIFRILGYIIGLIKPLIGGFAIAFILNVFVRMIEKKLFRVPDEILGSAWQKIRRPLSIFLSFCFVFGIIIILVTMLFPEVKAAIILFSRELPTYLANLQGLIDDVTTRFGMKSVQIPEFDIDIDQITILLGKFFNSEASGMVFNTAIDVTTSIVSVFANLIMSVVFAIYMLIRKEKLVTESKKILFAYLPLKDAKEALFVARLSNRIFSKFVTGQCMEAVIIGTLCFLGMTFFRFPYAPMISVLVGFTALIPVFGAFIGTAIGAFLILMIEPIQALWFIIFIIALQQFEGNLIYPKVVGSSIGLPAIWVMLAVLVGGTVGGVLGMLLSVPISSVIYCLIGRNTRKRLEAKRITDTDIRRL